MADIEEKALAFLEKSIKKKQNGFLWFLYLNDNRKDYKTSYEVTYDKEKLYQFLKNQDCMQEKNMDLLNLRRIMNM